MNRSTFLLLCMLFLSNYLRSQSITSVDIIKRPISYNQERIQLSLEYLEIRHGLIQKNPTINPKMIVLHYTDGGTLKSIFNYFNHPVIENARNYNKKQSALNVSAHYLIDRDGKIYQLMEDTLFARHIIGLNYCSIGVENIGSKKEPLTEAQVLSNVQLIRHLVRKFQIEYVIGHSEYVQFRQTDLWKETNPQYFTQKEDPGIEFMKQIRLRINDLNLKSKP